MPQAIKKMTEMGVFERLQRVNRQSNEHPIKMDLRCEKLSDKIYSFIYQNIFNAVYIPGQKINPREIAQEFGVSIMPVRDALERLEQQGWIIRYPQSGTYVRKIDLEEVNRDTESRTMIESEALMNLVENGTDAEIEQLKHIAAEIEEAAVVQDLERYEKNDLEFHRCIVELGCGEHLVANHREIINRCNYRFFVVVLTCEKLKTHDIFNLKKIPVSHKEIMDAIEQRDLITALRRLRKHLAEGNKRVWEVVKMRKAIDPSIFKAMESF